VTSPVAIGAARVARNTDPSRHGWVALLALLGLMLIDLGLSSRPARAGSSYLRHIAKIEKRIASLESAADGPDLTDRQRAIVSLSQQIADVSRVGALLDDRPARNRLERCHDKLGRLSSSLPAPPPKIEFSIAPSPDPKPKSSEELAPPTAKPAEVSLAAVLKGVLGAKAALTSIPHLGEIDSRKIRFTQESIADHFRDNRTLVGLSDGLRQGQIKAQDIPPIRIFEHDGLFFTLDNRRLKAFQDAGVPIRYRAALPQEIKEDRIKFTSRNGGVGIRLRHPRSAH
jgi:hypothetical protein